MEFDLVIRNGTIIDGTGRPRFGADLGLRDGQIAAIADGEPVLAEKGHPFDDQPFRINNSFG